MVIKYGFFVNKNNQQILNSYIAINDKAVSRFFENLHRFQHQCLDKSRVENNISLVEVANYSASLKL